MASAPYVGGLFKRGISRLASHAGGRPPTARWLGLDITITASPANDAAALAVSRIYGSAAPVPTWAVVESALNAFTFGWATIAHHGRMQQRGDCARQVVEPPSSFRRNVRWRQPESMINVPRRY